MAKKQKHPEHINLERYLISYADFITLLFATFVVLYALSQSDINDFKSLESSIKSAFSAPSIIQGSEGVMGSNSDSLFDTAQGDSMIAPLMMEYMSQKYEDQSLSEIERAVNDMIKQDAADQGIEAIKTDRGLVIRFNDDLLFESGSAILTPAAKKKLDTVGSIIMKKFVLHYMRIEGHTDSEKIKSSLYPSNWELSSARASAIIRYFIDRFHFLPSLFTAVGYADTRPLVANDTPSNKKLNRRVEILILKNKFKSSENPMDDFMRLTKKEQEELQKRRFDSVDRIQSISEAIRRRPELQQTSKADAIISNRAYENESKRISKEVKALDSATQRKITGQGTWLKPPAASVSPVVKQTSTYPTKNKFQQAVGNQFGMSEK